MKKLPLQGITALGFSAGILSAIVFANSPRPFDLIGIKFCPRTANNTEDSQLRLDKKYCRIENKMLREIWESEQFKASTPLPEDSFVIRQIPKINNSLWFLVAPVSMAVGYAAYAKKCEQDEINAHFELEGFKTQIRETGVMAREERKFKTEVTEMKFDTLRVKNGMISVDAMSEQLKRKSEIQDKMHQAALKQLDLGISEMDKGIAENIRDSHKADKERLGKAALPDKQTESKNEKVNSMIEMLKSHEDGWLWKIIDNQKPIWVLGEAGSGKSTLAASIVMLRQYLFNMPLYQLVDAHAGDNLRNAWKYLKPQFIAQTEEEIGKAFDDSRNRWLDRINNQSDKLPQQLLVDEFTNYSESDITKEPAKKFVKASLSDPRKAEERLVCIAHFFTNTAVGGSDGTAKGRARGTIQIDRKTADGRTPLSNITINGLNNNDGDSEIDKKVTIPDWLSPANIHKHFN